MIGTILLVVVLRWTSLQRAEAHRVLAAREQQERDNAKPVIDWCMATWAVAGCL